MLKKEDIPKNFHLATGVVDNGFFSEEMKVLLTIRLVSIAREQPHFTILLELFERNSLKSCIEDLFDRCIIEWKWKTIPNGSNIKEYFVTPENEEVVDNIIERFVFEKEE